MRTNSLCIALNSRLRVAAALARSGRIAEALAEAKKAVELAPGSRKARYQRALTVFEAKLGPGHPNVAMGGADARAWAVPAVRSLE